MWKATRHILKLVVKKPRNSDSDIFKRNKKEIT